MISFEREKKLLLATLAFVAVLPLPFNEPRPVGVVGLPVVGLYLLVLGAFMRQAYRGSQRRLPVWAMNVLGLLYVPLFLADLRSAIGSNVVRPMVHLLMFGLLVKLFSMSKEKEKWHLCLLIFFIFLAAMATSVHPLIAVYLITFLVLSMRLFFRFVQFHLAESHPRAFTGSLQMPLRSLLASGVLITLMVSVPLFALMPRLHAPYVVGRGFPVRGASNTIGFGDAVRLDEVGRVRGNSQIALRLKMEDDQVAPPLRFRGASYELLEGASWEHRGDQASRLLPVAATLYRLADERPRTKMRIWLEPLGSKILVLPEEAASIEISGRLFEDVAGDISMLTVPKSLLEYRVGLGRNAAPRGLPPDLDSDSEPTLDPGGISPRIAELAESLVGGMSPLDKAQRLERHLMSSYQYSLDFVGRVSQQPIDDFLFRYRDGHCEYFASAMVLMLRSQGVPARFVTGFVGAEMNPLEDYFVVRQSNAHAWVEAYLPERGWMAFDPTPEIGRPGSAPPNLSLMLRQAWDFLEFRWDRYIMSYGSLDQLGLLVSLRKFWSSLRDEPKPDRSPRVETPQQERSPRPPFELGRLLLPQVSMWAIAAFLSLLLVVLRLRRNRFSATRAYADLKRLLSRRDPELSDAVAPLALYARIRRRFPEAAPQAMALIGLYLRESYAGVKLAEPETAVARLALRRLRVELRR